MAAAHFEESGQTIHDATVMVDAAACNDASGRARSPLQPTGPQAAQPVAKTSPRGRPPIAPSSAEHAKRMLERSTAVPIKRFDSADYFLSQYMDQQKVAAAREALNARRQLSPRDEEGEENTHSAMPARSDRPTAPASPSRLAFSSLKVASPARLGAKSPTDMR